MSINSHVVIGNAARDAAVLFDARQWTWANNDVPDAHDIADKFDDFLRDLKGIGENGHVRSGRLMVLRNEYNNEPDIEYTLCLDLGVLHEPKS